MLLRSELQKQACLQVKVKVKEMRWIPAIARGIAILEYKNLRTRIVKPSTTSGPTLNSKQEIMFATMDTFGLFFNEIS